MYYRNEEHKNFYKEKWGQAISKDTYAKSIIYLLASNKETRTHFDEIYNIKQNEIEISSLKKPWQTNESSYICRLAFNLFGGIAADDVESEEASYSYTVSSIFANLDMNTCMEACKIRFLPNSIDF